MRPHVIEDWHKVMVSGDVSTLPELLHDDAVYSLFPTSNMDIVGLQCFGHLGMSKYIIGVDRLLDRDTVLPRPPAGDL